MNTLRPGIIRTADRSQRGTYIVINGSAGSALRSSFTGRAPLTGVNVSENVDAAITQTLNNDLLVNSFGYTPVTITLRGLDLYAGICSSMARGVSLPAFFAMYNVHRNPTARLDVGIYRGGQGATYRCVVLALSSGAEASSSKHGVGEYTLTLMGVHL